MNGYHKWTKEEEEIFREAIVQFKYNWVRIQQNILPHISVKSMKNKYYQRMHNNSIIKSSSIVSDEEVYKLIKIIMYQNLQ
ncbi:Conserved_hypothetical protein [Hexamita inflata]|uniref:Myb-like domain-containing protein n=1 Tax=Hexamita inflata TaxID=28002 RepID=A0AA86NTG6_9EUKA|nr:Conserved hypothetical protein [Hexamita inflata]